ncbi:hypothetical protein MNBD_GAMMA26-2263 [hydrothermal vent metagenome]|uniref:Uncharacterized protein n=1 Tax=hydrothermal vent metagenome TaxID=652676 RepID=A0A3B1BRV4_9ZZZZ
MTMLLNSIKPGQPSLKSAKLRLISDYRDEADNERARALLYEVLAEG